MMWEVKEEETVMQIDPSQSILGKISLCLCVYNGAGAQAR